MAMGHRPESATAPLTDLDYVGIALAAVTGIIHLYEGIEDLGEGFIAILFILAGLGFLGAIVLLWMGYRR